MSRAMVISGSSSDLRGRSSSSKANPTSIRMCSGLGIQTPEHILIDVGFAFDELDRPRASLEEPQITIARDINQAFDGASVALVVHEDGRRDFVVIPRVVLVVLEVALDRARRHVERDRHW